MFFLQILFFTSSAMSRGQLRRIIEHYKNALTCFPSDKMHPTDFEEWLWAEHTWHTHFGEFVASNRPNVNQHDRMHVYSAIFGEELPRFSVVDIIGKLKKAYIGSDNCGNLVSALSAAEVVRSEVPALRVNVASLAHFLEIHEDEIALALGLRTTTRHGSPS